MKFGMFLLGLFKRRKFGPLSASPFGLAVTFVLVVGVPVAILVEFGRYWQDQSVKATQVMPGFLYAFPIAAQARLMQETTGRWPASLAEIEAAKVQAPRYGRTLLLGNGEVRVVFERSPGTPGSSLGLHVVVRGGEHFLDCRAEGFRWSALPEPCRSGAEPWRVNWPPESARAAK